MEYTKLQNKIATIVYTVMTEKLLHMKSTTSQDDWEEHMTIGKEPNEKLLNKIKETVSSKYNLDSNKPVTSVADSRDMSDNHSPISNLDFTGLNRQQAKEELAKVIDAKVERISKVDLTEIRADLPNKEIMKERAAERISERRTRRKEKKTVKEDTDFTKESIYTDYRPTSVLDIIKPENFTDAEYEYKEENQKEVKSNKPSAAIDVSIDRVFIISHLFFKKIGIVINQLSSLIFLILCKILHPFINVIFAKEKITSEKMSGFIVWLDVKIDQLSNIINKVINFIILKFNQLREYADLNKKKLLIQFGVSVAVVTLIVLAIGKMTAYEYIYNGKVLGLVKNQEDVYKIIDVIGDKLSYEYHAEIKIDKEKDITFNKVIAINKDLDDKEDILDRLTYMKDMKARGYGIFVNGNMVAILESEESAEEILDDIKSKFIKDDEKIKYKKIGFAEVVKIKDVDTKLGNIQKKEDLMEYMLTGAKQKKIHLVKPGDTFSGIAKMYGLEQSQLQASNPDLNPEKLSIDQEVTLTQAVPVVTIQTIEVATYSEPIPYEVTYENTNSIYKGEQTVKLRGKNGEKEVVAEIVRNNGFETSRTEIQSTIISQPTSQVVLVGTKDPPPLIGTGTFQYPVRGKLTSRFGTRWGRLHAGIDLAAPTGTKIRAADGGKVIASGYSGSYGYMIKIDHGGNRVTVYAHCSKLFVKTGDKVYQGQHIANVGNTGRSTGPHLHFEIQINGKPKNPLSYL